MVVSGEGLECMCDKHCKALTSAPVWIVYEWGNYGGDSEIVVKRIFEVIMALALSGNILLALGGAVFWINAICINSSH